MGRREKAPAQYTPTVGAVNRVERSGPGRLGRVGWSRHEGRRNPPRTDRRLRSYHPGMSNEHSEPKDKVSPADVRREERGSSGGRWVVVVDGHEAEMTFSRASPVLIIIDHTEVPDALRGRGVGQALVLRSVEDARREGFRIIPLCPFANAQFKRHPEWRDVLSA